MFMSRGIQTSATSMSMLRAIQETFKPTFLIASSVHVDDPYKSFCKGRITERVGYVISVAGWQHRLHKIILHYDKLPLVENSILLLLLPFYCHHRYWVLMNMESRDNRTCSQTPYIAKRENGEAASDDQMFGEISGVFSLNL
ncbi:hypothetical protein ARMGADRAFT_1041053 [Armillaria gallica]|uniref:Uncharacterized protein n=1 Tax=Armillaria gallica TaxID=47427 RepID=A0A2H3C7P3_ARMGA|nr:hypothetical protein ARMGADRAFT_1041053 [Armillaria gallica]